jgi:hypothetical protein
MVADAGTGLWEAGGQEQENLGVLLVVMIGIMWADGLPVSIVGSAVVSVFDFDGDFKVVGEGVGDGQDREGAGDASVESEWVSGRGR